MVKKAKKKAAVRSEGAEVNGTEKQDHASLEEMVQVLSRALDFPAEEKPQVEEADAAAADQAKELLEVLKQLRPRLEALRKGTEALLDRFGDPEKDEDGIPLYVETKVQLMLNYVAGLCYYMLLKLRGVSVREHALIPKLLWIRTLLEKMKPIDQRLQYQQNKLLQWEEINAKAGPAGAVAGLEGLRPGALAMTVQDDEDEEAEEGAPKAQKEAESDGIYRPPKIAQVEYTGDHLTLKEKAERDFERKKARLERSEFVRSLREEFTDAPAEVLGDKRSARAEKVVRQMAEEREYEEDNMIRLRIKKSERRERKQMLRKGNSTSGGTVSLDDATADFRELAAGFGSGGGGPRGRKGRGSALQEYHEAARRVKDARSVVAESVGSLGDFGRKKGKGGGKSSGPLKRKRR